MEAPAEKTTRAWQPLTPRGVAAFAHASLGRLLLVQLLAASLVAASVLWFLHTAWFPVVGDAINRLPDRGRIAFGQLEWHGESVEELAENHFLALAVDLNHQATARSPAHLQVEFGRSDCRIFSLFGFVEEPYPLAWTVPLNRTELVPWWGAWLPPILAMVALAVILGLTLLWALVASLYLLPAWLVGFFANRDLTLGGSWRVAGAALVPGGLLMAGAIFSYGLGLINLVELAAVTAVHVLLGWMYLALSPLCLPRLPKDSGAKGNPFDSTSPKPGVQPDHDTESHP